MVVGQELRELAGPDEGDVKLLLFIAQRNSQQKRRGAGV
jgi:hypothetical protein